LNLFYAFLLFFVYQSSKPPSGQAGCREVQGATEQFFFFVSFLDGVGIGEAMKTCQDLA
jgi:hypothetical protein